MTSLDALHLQLWGKADPARAGVGPSWHPLIAHMLDVAACAEVLLRHARPQRLAAMARAIQLAPSDALRWLVFFTALHDLGKATPAFQRKVDDATARLRALGFDFPESNEPHGEMGAVLVPPVLEAHGVPPRLARLASRAVAAHHGSFATAVQLNELDGVRAHVGKTAPWRTAREQLVGALAELCDLGSLPRPANPQTNAALNALGADLAGLATAADWLGSNADVFVYTQVTEPTVYFERARALASDAVEEAGFRAAPRPVARSFEALFKRSPWPLHAVVAELLPELGPGSLVIVEAPMGEGKTEAALLIYDALAARGADGLYFALPTQATANQILGRVERYLAASFDEAHNLHLIHGGAALSDRYEELKRRARFRSIGESAANSMDQAPVADAWFTRSKRALLAPLGVGTVDQALLGVLRAKHHFLRLHGLAGKVFIVDEVHAYDTYTSEILAGLCAWLRALDATVVLLSATLSSVQRARLLAAYGVDSANEPLRSSAPYPRITIANGSSARFVSFPARRPPIQIDIIWKARDAVLGDLVGALADGGCVAWIVNTVASAQRLYLDLVARKAAGQLPGHVEVGLLHARFPFADRSARERAAERAFGPAGPDTHRPRAAILVGTQVLEQSLDLDFDLMITELAPVDLVLQRAGRLHRHDRARPAPLRERTLWIEQPQGADSPEGPSFGAAEFVYDEEVLLRSYIALVPLSRVELPGDIEPLVERVYAPAPEELVSEALAPRIARTARERVADSDHERYTASLRRLEPPDARDPFAAFSCFFDDEDPEIHEALRAVTRLGDPSVAVVPVVSSGGRLGLFGAPNVIFDAADKDLPFAMATEIARRALSVSHKGLVHALLADHPRAFERSGLLRHHRLLRLDAEGRTQIGKTRLHLDPELGLVIGDLHPSEETRP